MAVSTTAAPQQYKQSSRKGKKAWRKNVDVTEVEEGLDNVRDEIIQGGILAEKPSEELFTVDTVGSQQIQEKYRKTHKPLKIDEILSKRSAVPAVHTRKRGNVGDGIFSPRSKRPKTNFVSHKDLQRLKDRASGVNTGKELLVDTTQNASYDPWTDHEAPKYEEFDFLDDVKSIRAPRSIRRAPVSLLASMKQLPAVIKPRGAMSYNPAFQDWDEALTAEGEKEVLAEHKRLEEKRKHEETQARIEAAQGERDEVLTEDESAWEGFESGYDEGEQDEKRQPKRKTPSERNKVNRRKKAEAESKHLEAMKTRGQRDASARKLVEKTQGQGSNSTAELVRTEVRSSDDEYDDRILRRRRLGKHHIPERDLEIVLPDELQDSLRLLKPEGNLLKDRFRNLQIQGKLETRKPISQPKKRRRTVTEKWTYKDFTISA